MPTTNLISISLGDSLLQSGYGTPDHSGSTANMYLDITNGEVNTLSNSYAATGVTQQWGSIGEVQSVSITSKDSSTTITTSSTAVWYTLSASTYNWTTLLANGFSVNNGRVTLTGLTGNYYINASATLKSIGAANLIQYRIGVSKNAASPVAGFYSSSSFQNNATGSAYMTINVFGITSLTSGDTLELALNSPNQASSALNLSGITFTVEYMD